jgi:hypothetical protein
VYVTSQVAGIAGVRHHTRPIFLTFDLEVYFHYSFKEVLKKIYISMNTVSAYVCIYMHLSTMLPTYIYKIFGFYISKFPAIMSYVVFFRIKTLHSWYQQVFLPQISSVHPLQASLHITSPQPF